MQRISALVEKLKDFSNEDGQPDLIELDIMLDYTKSIYAALLEMRRQADAKSPEISEPDFQSEDEYDIEESFIEDDEADDDSGEPVNPVNVADPVINDNKPVRDIRSSIGINDKYQLISELFGNDKNAYEQKIAELNQLKTHQEALDWLNNNIFLKNWEEHSESVQLLFYIVNKFFSAT